MQKFILIISAVCLSVLTNAQNGAYFEYKISSSKGYTGAMKINFSEFGHSNEFNMVVPQMPGGGIMNKSLYMKSAPDVIYMINDKNKSYSESKKSDVQSEDKKNYTIKKVGEETVNGYKCVHAIITSDKETQDVWNTKDIKDFNKYNEAFATNKRSGSVKRDQALKDAGCDGIMVKMLHKGGDREGDMTMELVKVEKKNYSKSDFDIPVGYSKSGGGANAGSAAGAVPGMKTQEEIMKMTPEERAKWAEEMKKQYGGQQKK